MLRVPRRGLLRAAVQLPAVFAAGAVVAGCSDPQTGSLKLDVKPDDVEKEVNKLGNPGAGAGAQPQRGGPAQRHR